MKYSTRKQYVDHIGKASPVVVKVGTEVVTNGEGRLNGDRIDNIASQVLWLYSRGQFPVLVTSGAVGAGDEHLASKAGEDLYLRRLHAGVGQPLLMEKYISAFGKHKRVVSQILITHENLSPDSTNKELLEMIYGYWGRGITPIFNNNDPISSTELKGRHFGDNDRPAYELAVAINAEAIFTLTATDGLRDYSVRDRRVDMVQDINKAKKLVNSSKKTNIGTGGMASKLTHIGLAMDKGIPHVLLSGLEERSIQAFLEYENRGTLFIPKGFGE